MTTLWDRLDKHWRDIISAEFDRSKMGELEKFLRKLEQFLLRERSRHDVYPKEADIFNALNLTAFDDIKVVIIGQDPYHGEGQANGLCFSVPKGVDIPRSLNNIYKEIDPIKMPSDGDLTEWAKQGVLLLNAVLTVREGRPGSHQGKGWEEFTDAIIRAVSKKPEPVVFLLWGLRAQEKCALIDAKKHKVLKASHPSPRSAHRKPTDCDKFVDCGHFKSTNEYLKQHGRKPINWQ